MCVRLWGLFVKGLRFCIYDSGFRGSILSCVSQASGSRVLKAIQLPNTRSKSHKDVLDQRRDLGLSLRARVTCPDSSRESLCSVLTTICC